MQPTEDAGGMADPPIGSSNPSGGLPDPSAGLPDSGTPLPPSPLALEAIALAQSADPEDHERLAQMLVDGAYLDRLDLPEVAMSIDPILLQLTRVLRAAARQSVVLDRLSGDELYGEPGHRQAALIEASALARSPGEGLVRFWRHQLDPDADELETTIRALVQNQSDVALGVLSEAFADEEFDTELVLAWFRGPVLEHRQDERLLVGLERLLQSGKLGPKRRYGLIEALFDYRPSDWYYTTGAPPEPPERSELGVGARETLGDIADLAVREGVIGSDRRAQIEKDLSEGL